MTGRAGIGCDRLVHRTPRTIRTLVAALLLIAVASSRSQAQSDTGSARPDHGQSTSAAAGPIVVLPSQRLPHPSSLRAKGGGPIVVLQNATPEMNAPANSNRDQVDDRPRQPRQTPSAQPGAAEAMPANLEGNRAAGFREPAALDALYGATHFRSTAPRREPDGFFGAPNAGMLTAGCGVRRDGRQPPNMADKCMQALAFAVSPPPATREVLPRNLPRIPPKIPRESQAGPVRRSWSSHLWCRCAPSSIAISSTPTCARPISTTPSFSD